MLAAYQVVIQEFTGKDVLGVCRAGPDCAAKIDIGLGPVSIPRLSLTAFAVVVVALTMVREAMTRPAGSSVVSP